MTDNAPGPLQFHANARSPLFRAMKEDGQRLVGSLKLTLKDDVTGSVAKAESPLSFAVFSADEIVGLRNGAILGVAPRPFTHGAETTKLPHVDFAEQDFPWRYTPKENSPTLKPWLALLVGTPEQLVIKEGQLVTASSDLLTHYLLEKSHLWAHVQNGRSRLLANVELQKFTEYVAALVPAFDALGGPAWSNGVLSDHAVRTVLYSWKFWTAEAGDFETLAAALKVKEGGDLGLAKLRYARHVEEPSIEIDVTLEARGALTSLKLPPVTPEAIDKEAMVREDLNALAQDVKDVGEPLRDIVGLPQYGRPWLPDPRSTIWGKKLNDDPRYRSISGLGAWLGIEAQEELMKAAVEQAGSLLEASQRIRQLAQGLLASQSLWLRWLPDHPLRRLSLFGPAMGRMRASDGRRVLDRVTSGTSPLAPALFSSAAMRVLRNGTARTRHHNGTFDRAEALEAANRPIDPTIGTAAGLPHANDVLGKLGFLPLEKQFGLKPIVPRLLERLYEIGEKFDGQPNSPDMRSELLRALVQSDLGCAQDITGILEQSGLRLLVKEQIVRTVLRMCFYDTNAETEGIELAFVLDSLLPPPPSFVRPVELSKLAGVIGAAIDPTQDKPPAWRRVASTIEGLDLSHLAPPELPLGLYFPTWQLLNKLAKEWLLPGVGDLPKDSVVSLKTNPAFINAFMVGINTQFMREMRWRNLPVDPTFTPLRRFWGRVNYERTPAAEDVARQPDILPFLEWVKAPEADLDSPKLVLQDPGDIKSTEDLVVVFRTDLFRRYPSTLVYLVRKSGNATLDDDNLKTTPDFTYNAGEIDSRTYVGPNFMAELETDLHAFLFDIDPNTLDDYWLILDEPPAELRFEYKPHPVPDSPDVTSVDFAKSTIDHPTRVAWDGHYLKEQVD